MNADKQKTTFILGAGASYGHVSNEAKKPPIMNNFLSSSVMAGILNESYFPELSEHIKKTAGSEKLLDACGIIETSSNLEDFLGNVEDSWVLHLGLFYIHRYLGTFCCNHLSRQSAYIKLAHYIKNNSKHVKGVINLNYDTLFDKALNNASITFDYGFQNKKSKYMFYIKPHGSLNYRYPYARLIKISCKCWNEFVKLKPSTILTNTFSGRSIETYEPIFKFENDFCIDGVLKYIPCIVMPIGRNKDFFQFDDYSKMWENVNNILKDTTELIVIGCALNDEDEHLWEKIDVLDKNTSIKIVSGSLREAQIIADKFQQRNFTNVEPINVNGFREYTDNHLV